MRLLTSSLCFHQRWKKGREGIKKGREEWGKKRGRKDKNCIRRLSHAPHTKSSNIFAVQENPPLLSSPLFKLFLSTFSRLKHFQLLWWDLSVGRSKGGFLRREIMKLCLPTYHAKWPGGYWVQWPQGKIRLSRCACPDEITQDEASAARVLVDAKSPSQSGTSS